MDKLENIKKILITSAVILGLGIGGYFIIRSIVRRRGWGKDSKRGLGYKGVRDISDRALIVLRTKYGIVPSYSDNTYKLQAEKIYNAMYGIGTTVNEVIPVLGQMRNSADLAKLYKAFGMRKEMFPYSLEGELDLPSWLVNEKQLSYSPTFKALVKAMSEDKTNFPKSLTQLSADYKESRYV